MIEHGIYNCDCMEGLRGLPDDYVNCVVTSPPYWGLRDYGIDGQLGLEATLDEYIAKMVEIFREVRRVLRPDGTLWLNMGDSFQDKQLIGQPWRVAFALQADGWWLRSDIIWAKPNPIPESVTDRPTKSHEYIFLMSKSAQYYYDADAIREAHAFPDDNNRYAGINREIKGQSKYGFSGKQRILNPAGRNKRTVWTVATQPFPEAHFATYPEKLIEPCILAGCPVDGIVLDPFMGSGTTAVVAANNGRNWIGFELSPEYIKLAEKRIPARQEMLL